MSRATSEGVAVVGALAGSVSVRVIVIVTVLVTVLVTMIVAVLVAVLVTMRGVRSMRVNQRATRVRRLLKLFLQPAHHAVQPHSIAQIRKNEWTLAAHAPRVALHHIQRRAHIRRQ